MKQNNSWSQDLYQETIRFAGEVHGDQKIPGTGLPYIIHLSNVCMEIFAAISAGEADKPDLAMQCALLHDAMEDAGVTFIEIENTFGRSVADGVSALTKNKKTEKENRMADSIERIKLQPREVWMVKLGDRITNLQSPPAHWTNKRISDYREEAEYILDHLGEASPILSKRLKQKIKNYP